MILRNKVTSMSNRARGKIGAGSRRLSKNNKHFITHFPGACRKSLAMVHVVRLVQSSRLSKKNQALHSLLQRRQKNNLAMRIY